MNHPTAISLALVLAAAPLLASADESGIATPVPEPADASTANSWEGALPGLRRPRERLITAGQPASSAWPLLAQRGVGLVVNLRPKAELGDRDEAAEVAQAGLAYREIPVAGADGITEANARQLWSLLQDAKGEVLVHCASGNRVGALLALGAAKAGGMAPEAALDLGRRAGLAGAEARVRELLQLPALAADKE